MIPRHSVLLAALLVLLAVGCRVDVDVSVAMEDDGSGTVAVDVRLDEEATARAPEMGEILLTTDLVDAGWAVSPVESTSGGGTLVSASKPFGTPAELRAVLGEISGPDTLFRDLEAFRERPFGEIDLGFGGVLDPTGGLEQFSDDDLTEALGGFPLGIDLAELGEDLGVAPGSTVTVNLEVVLEGRQEPDPAVWSVRMDGEQPVRFAARSTVQLDEPRRWVRWAVVAVVALVVVVLVELFVSWRRVRREPR